jgi:hypothetical protein
VLEPGGHPRIDLIRTYEVVVSFVGEKEVYLPLLLSQTIFNWSLAPVEANVDSARVDMVAQCGAGDQPQIDLLSMHTRL